MLFSFFLGVCVEAKKKWKGSVEAENNSRVFVARFRRNLSFLHAMKTSRQALVLARCAFLLMNLVDCPTHPTHTPMNLLMRLLHLPAVCTCVRVCVPFVTATPSVFEWPQFSPQVVVLDSEPVTTCAGRCHNTSHIADGWWRHDEASHAVWWWVCCGGADERW